MCGCATVRRCVGHCVVGSSYLPCSSRVAMPTAAYRETLLQWLMAAILIVAWLTSIRPHPHGERMEALRTRRFRIQAQTAVAP